MKDYERNGAKLVEHTLRTCLETRQQAHKEQGSLIQQLAAGYKSSRHIVVSTRKQLRTTPLLSLEKELDEQGELVRKMIETGRKAVEC